MNKDTLGKTIIVSVVVIGMVVAALIYKGMDSTENSSGNMDDSMSDGTTSSSTEMTETNMIVYKDFDVEQPLVRVKKGTTVTWTNEDNAMHDVTPTSPTEEFKASELFGKGETYSVTFNTVGSYEYICSPHPYMKGTVEVVES